MNQAFKEESPSVAGQSMTPPCTFIFQLKRAEECHLLPLELGWKYLCLAPSGAMSACQPPLYHHSNYITEMEAKPTGPGERIETDM